MGQGYLLARPMSFERLRWYLRGVGHQAERAPSSGNGVVMARPIAASGSGLG